MIAERPAWQVRNWRRVVERRRAETADFRDLLDVLISSDIHFADETAADAAYLVLLRRNPCSSKANGCLCVTCRRLDEFRMRSLGGRVVPLGPHLRQGC